MGRKPNQVVNAEINRLRRIIEDSIGTNKSDQDIIQELDIKERTFYYYKERIREQDKAVWYEMAKESLEERSGKIMKAMDYAQKVYKDIADNSPDHKARIQAANQIVQNNVWALQLLERGPKIMPKLEAKVIHIEPETNQESIRDQTV